MEKQNKSYHYGFSAILALIILVAVLAIGAIVYYLATNKPPTGDPLTKDALEEVSVLAPEFDMSASPLPKLNVSSLNLNSPDLPTDFFSGMSLDTRISVPSANTAISMPSINFSYTPSSQPEIPQVPPASNPGTQPSSGGQQGADCSSFSSVPSCSYVGATGSEAYNACKSCYPNK